MGRFSFLRGGRELGGGEKGTAIEDDGGLPIANVVDAA